MQLNVEIPSHFPDAVQCTPEQFMQEAKFAMAAKLYEIGRLSSGMAAVLAGVSRVQFLLELSRYGVPVIDLTENEISDDVNNA